MIFILLVVLCLSCSLSYGAVNTNNFKSPIGFLFAHGLGGDKTQVDWYAPGNSLHWSILKEPYYSFDFPEVVYKKVHGKLVKQPMDINKVSLAQEGDIAALAHEHANIREKKTIHKQVLVGVSRGAATIITYMATREVKDVAAVVLEAPFDNLTTIINYGAQQAGNTVSAKERMQAMWSFPAYKQHGIKPIDVVQNINKAIPVIFVHSQKDGLIPFSASLDLYNKLKNTGHKHVYFLELAHGVHANYQTGADAAIYQAVVHAFYQRYRLPYDPVKAQLGKAKLTRCQF